MLVSKEMNKDAILNQIQLMQKALADGRLDILRSLLIDLKVFCLK
jgi:hypothetical protein